MKTKAPEPLTVVQKRRKQAVQESVAYARSVESNPEMQKILKRERKQGQSMTREEFRKKYL